MESWGLSYESIMSIPVTRRHRLVAQKSDLERKRQQNHEASMSRVRRARRSR